MRLVKLFEEFIKEGIVKRITPDKQRVKSLIAESERKMSSLYKHIEKLGFSDENSNDYVEYCYDIVMYLIRAKLYM